MYTIKKFEKHLVEHCMYYSGDQCDNPKDLIKHIKSMGGKKRHVDVVVKYHIKDQIRQVSPGYDRDLLTLKYSEFLP